MEGRSSTGKYKCLEASLMVNFWDDQHLLCCMTVFSCIIIITIKCFASQDFAEFTEHTKSDLVRLFTCVLSN
jgi:hypothetical protein